MVMGELVQDTDVVVIGGGPGGYAAAFRAADLGLDTTLIDVSGRLGGVCLFRGCIPSKTYLHLTELIHDTAKSAETGLSFGRPTIDISAVRTWKDAVIGRLADGLLGLSRQRGVQLIQGRAEFEGSHRIKLHDADVSALRFKHAVIAAGSHPIAFLGAPFQKDGRIMNSTAALALPEIPRNLLVVGGGYVGLELGMIYAALGAEVHLAELGGRLLPGMDPDLVEPLRNRLDRTFEAIHLGARVLSMTEEPAGAAVSLLTGDGRTISRTFDRVLVAIGRTPNTQGLGLETTGVRTDGRGFIRVDETLRTDDPSIFAVGDVTGNMMLAHKASREGKIAAEVIAGRRSAFDATAIPAVVYTDPQIACCGLTEEAARREARPVVIHRFPWKYSGRAVTMGRTEGLTKILMDPSSGRILGMGIVGRDAESLISEGVLAVEMGAVAEDVAFSIHPHPTLSETEAEAAELFLGGALHAPTPR